MLVDVVQAYNYASDAREVKSIARDIDHNVRFKSYSLSVSLLHEGSWLIIGSADHASAFCCFLTSNSARCAPLSTYCVCTLGGEAVDSTLMHTKLCAYSSRSCVR